MGSDDYVTKPYSPKELMLRISNILKRVYKDNNSKIVYETYSINKEKRTVIENDGEKIKEDMTEKIFLPYVKGDNGQSGLGLSIVKKQ